MFEPRATATDQGLLDPSRGKNERHTLAKTLQARLPKLEQRFGDTLRKVTSLCAAPGQSDCNRAFGFATACVLTARDPMTRLANDFTDQHLGL